MAAGSNPSLRFCSVLMAFHFALSASFQLNDLDWYFWFPLYAVACVVNLINGVKTEKKTRKMAEFAVCLGMFLFIKVILEDFAHGIAGFWSFDARERVVREKIGSGMVIGSMFMQLESLASHPNHPRNQKRAQVANLGMLFLVGISYSLSLFFFVFQHGEMKL